MRRRLFAEETDACCIPVSKTVFLQTQHCHTMELITSENILLVGSTLIIKEDTPTA